MIIDEFEQLWEAQKQFYPDLLTDDAREKVFDTIFYQRPFLKRERLAQLVGQCQFEPSEKRARIGHRLVQKYRIYQETANLRLIAPDGAERTLTLAELKELRDYLETNKELEFEAEQNKISRAHKLLNLDPNIVINFAAAKRKALKGNVVEVEFRKALGEVWVNLTEEKKDALNELVLEEDDEDRLIQRAKEEFGLDDEAAKKLTEIVLPSNFGRVSLAAIRKLLPLMEEGHDLSEALKAAGYDKREPELRLDYLPFPPGTRFGKREEKLVQEGLVLPHTTEVTNPVVRKALFEVRKLVNAIIRKYGKPDRIVVELARDTRGSIEDRREIQREQRQRERENEMIKKELISGGLTDPSKTDIVKYRLWLECNKTCPYSGRPISFEQLFLSGEVDIEHIIPYGRSLDDSFANKTLCFRDWNQKKGDRTPWEAFGESDPEAYEKMLQRVRAFQGDFRPKLRRFIQREVNLDACIDRQLNDTRYIARVVRNYLSVLGIPVGVARGQVTATLRRCWGLNTILSPDGSDEKNRSDHRHHAVDAAVIAMTTAKHLKNLAHREDFRREKQAFPQPWDGFRKAVDEAVKAIIVSHAPTRRVRGPLHEETNYGPTQEEDEFVYRKPLADLTINEVKDKIRDKRIRDLVMKRLDEKWPGWRDKAGTERIPAGVFPESDPLLLPNRNGGDPIPVRKVRLVTRLGNAIGLPHGNPSRFVKPGENHHLEIFEYEERGKLKWDAVPVTLFEAARRLRQHEPVVSRVHPEKPDARFVMSLCKNDMVKYRKNSGRIFRVRKFSKVQAFELVLDPHWLAVADGRKEEQVKITSLKELADVEKVNVTVLGEVTAAND
jgi:CRISPR-associated endonuclease Csn1